MTFLGKLWFPFCVIGAANLGQILQLNGLLELCEKMCSLWLSLSASVCVCVCVYAYTCVHVQLHPRCTYSQVEPIMGPTHAAAAQLFQLCVLYKDFFTQCFREVFTLLGESKCQWHLSLARMSSANKQGVSLTVLLLPVDSLCLRSTRKCHLCADSCLCCTHASTHRESPTAPHTASGSTMLSADPPNLPHAALTAFHCISK